MNIRIAAYTGGKNLTSARFRIRELVDTLATHSIFLDEYPAKFGAYPPVNRSIRPFWFAASAAERLISLAVSVNYDAVIFQRELISTIPTFERLSVRPAILDVDDSIWLHKNGRALSNLCAAVEVVVCGNEFIANYFESCGKDVEIIPTGIDVEKYLPLRPVNGRKIIGWSGSSSGFDFFTPAIQIQIAKILDKNRSWIFRVVADREPIFLDIPADRMEFVLWSPQVEVSAIQEMDIGIMPLDDTDWSRGKCSLKMLQYLACGIPVVVSNIGMNAEILAMSDVGYGINKDSDWAEALDALIQNDEHQKTFGELGRKLVVEKFSTVEVCKKWASVLKRII